ncbi:MULTISPECIES: SulP family inorganic anion transporter [Bacillaceae]|uniref:SulP family inorganic anion transporter n=1 Tax=Bacillaceae TaxID=186817 RepID=UPI000BFD6358|nr:MULTISPECIES: sulfate permease [Bacillaceae]PGT85198.1 sodium-independent anion transporter [Bacillus sp. AFS040349]UGB31958.1 sulfate permease [Metabacillus sp. B2-18]
MTIKKYIPPGLEQPYNKSLMMKDLIAGLTLFVMLVPQGMAYAMLAGLPPVMGLYASTIPLIIYALFASSRHLSVGPTAITSLLVFSGISSISEPGSQDYITLVILLALMVGTIQCLLGVLRLGFIVKFISPSVLGGYTSAAAIIIGLSQLKHLIGIDLGTYFQAHHLLIGIGRELTNLHGMTVLLGVSSIIFLVILKKINSRFPAALVLILLSSLSVYIFSLQEKGVQIVGTVPNGFPSLSLPTISLESVKQLIIPAVIIALLGFMESLAIGKTIADKEKYKLNPNRELKALGLANMLGSLFQIFPVNGSFSRSAVNHQSGGVTQLVSIFTSLFMIITLMLFTSYFYYLPSAVLAAIIIVAVYKLIDIEQAKFLFNVRSIDGWSWIVTFFVTLFVGIQWGILVGAIFNFCLLLARITRPNIIEMGYLEKEQIFRDIKRFPQATTLEDLIMIRVDSSIHFANISYLEEKIREFLYLKPLANMIIIDFSGVNDMDTPSFEVIEDLKEQLKKEKDISMFFVGMKGTVRETANKLGWDRKFNEEMNYYTIEKLLENKKIKVSTSSDKNHQTPYMYYI